VYEDFYLGSRGGGVNIKETKDMSRCPECGSDVLLACEVSNHPAPDRIKGKFCISCSTVFTEATNGPQEKREEKETSQETEAKERVLESTPASGRFRRWPSLS
jgi:DNA-directed RNA polymerase subunit RPC12/RpoP